VGDGSLTGQAAAFSITGSQAISKFTELAM
jgi:hypothetical protein